MHEVAVPRNATPRPSTVAPSPAAFAALIGANVALAFGAWFVRLADVGPVAAGFWRVTLAVPLLAAMAWAGGARPRRLGGALWVMIGVAGVSFAADLGAWHIGILHTSLANATLFGNSATLIYPLYGFLIARMWPTRTQGFALALAAAGAALLMGRSMQISADHVLGDLLCLLAGVLYTVYFIVMARARDTMAPLSALALSTVAGVLPLLVFAAALGETIWPRDWTPLILLAIVSQVIGQGLMIYALGKLSPLIVGLALLTQPIVAAAIGWIVFAERLGWPDLVGAAMVAAALVLVRKGEVDNSARPADLALEETR